MSKQLQIPGIGGILPGELIVDLFAGGGGASTGIESAVGRPPDIAINHDPAAIKMHMANHPATHHLCESIYDVDPLSVTHGQLVGILWASPSCTHFSRARGGTPVSKQERGLGWMVPKWAGITSPRLIFCENVPEWQTWGPVRRGQPVKKHAGKYFRQMIHQLEAMGYVVEWRIVNAAELSTATIRKRLYLIARNDGLTNEWPAIETGPKADRPFCTAAEHIDWSDLGKSIFERKKPLAPATCRRIAAGIVRYVIEAKRPFIVTCNHGKEGFRGQSVDEPMRTLTASRDAHGVVSPVLVSTAHGDFQERNGARTRTPEGPLGTISTSNNEALVSPTLVRMSHGEKSWNGVDEPLTTVTAQGNHHALVTAFLAKHYGGVVGHGVEQPLGTVTKVDHHSLVAANMVVLRNNADGRSIEAPSPTVLAGGQHLGLSAVHLTKFRQNSIGSAVDQPCPTITSGAGAKRPAGAAHALGIVAAHLSTIDQQSNRNGAAMPEEPLSAVTSKARHTVVAASLIQTGYGEREGQAPRTNSVEEPLGTVVAGGCKAALVAAFLTTYYKAGGTANGADAPVPAIVTRARHGLVTVDIDGTTYAITDIKLRMLKPEELAGCQGFPKSYILTGTQAEKIGRIGNSVCPPVAEALVRAQLRVPRAKRSAA